MSPAPHRKRLFDQTSDQAGSGAATVTDKRPAPPGSPVRGSIKWWTGRPSAAVQWWTRVDDVAAGFEQRATLLVEDAGPLQASPRPAQREALADPAEIDRSNEPELRRPRVDGQPAIGADGRRPNPANRPRGSVLCARSRVQIQPDAGVAEPLEIGQHPGVEQSSGDPAGPIGRHQRSRQPPIDPDAATATGDPIDRRQVARLTKPGHRLLGALELIRDEAPGVRGRFRWSPGDGQPERRAHRPALETLASGEGPAHARVRSGSATIRSRGGHWRHRRFSGRMRRSSRWRPASSPARLSVERLARRSACGPRAGPTKHCPRPS